MWFPFKNAIPLSELLKLFCLIVCKMAVAAAGTAVATSAAIFASSQQIVSATHSASNSNAGVSIASTYGKLLQCSDPSLRSINCSLVLFLIIRFFLKQDSLFLFIVVRIFIRILSRLLIIH